MIAYGKAIEDIVTIQAGLCEFWSNVHGWAPTIAADLLTSARLDRAASLSSVLLKWEPHAELSEGELILAWANLGSVMESSLRLFLSVYLKDYNADSGLLVGLGAIHTKGSKKGTILDPSILSLEKIRVFVVKKKFFTSAENQMIERIQHRRNAIHSFIEKEIGKPDDFVASVMEYRRFLASLAMRLPYPDEYGFLWLERAGKISYEASK